MFFWIDGFYVKHEPQEGAISKGRQGRPEQGMRVNRRIRAREVRVIDPDGTQLGIMPPEQALAKAMDVGLDLVEISAESRPPVCRIMDHGKYKYELKKKQGEARKNATNVTVKEVKFRPKIEQHDFAFKVDRIKKFLSEGSKVKVTMMFRGREITRQDLARAVMTRICVDTAEVGEVEYQPKLEGRNMIMILAPMRS